LSYFFIKSSCLGKEIEPVGTNEREFGLLCGDSFGIYPDRDAAFIGKVYRWGYVGVEVRSAWLSG
jgi:hypothetical protein